MATAYVPTECGALPADETIERSDQEPSEAVRSPGSLPLDQRPLIEDFEQERNQLVGGEPLQAGVSQRLEAADCVLVPAPVAGLS
jgi:hypothetical protein